MGRKSREKKLRTLMRESGTAPVVATRQTSPGLRKMSEVLLDVAEPMLEDPDLPDDPDTFKATLNLVAALWNASRPGVPDGGKAEKQKILDRMRDFALAPVPPEVERQCDEVMDRARSRYPDEDQLIVGVQVTVGSDDRYYINVATVASM